jgi:hypothetical protein
MIFEPLLPCKVVGTIEQRGLHNALMNLILFIMQAQK